MAPLDVITDYVEAQRRARLSVSLMARSLWDRIGNGDFDAAWDVLGPQVESVIATGQRAAAAKAGTYVESMLHELGITGPNARHQVSPIGFSGVSSTGRPLDNLVYQPVIAARTALGQGATLPDALRTGRNLLDSIVNSQVVDAGRAAESTGIAMRPWLTGWIRMTMVPCCDRCAVLAGKFYLFNSGFERHPRCKCVHVPANEVGQGGLGFDVNEAVRQNLVTGLSAADRQAILDGASPGVVVNAKRGGMTTERADGTKVKTSPLSRGRTRPRPETIYELAKDRADAIRLLEKYGYITK